jgi:hypothetical protein
VAGLLAGFLLDGVVAALVLGAYFRGVLSRGDAQLWVTFGMFVGPLVGGAIMLVGFRRFARDFGAGKKSTESGGKPDRDGRGAL